MAVAPADGTSDGNISALTALNLTDTNFSYGVDYLGYAMKQAGGVRDFYTKSQLAAPADCSVPGQSLTGSVSVPVPQQFELS